MYRLQQYESRLIESGHHEQTPFFREAVSLIDNCTKLLKDDRILLRNKIKQYFRSLRENRSIENDQQLDHFKHLIQIFVEANKKKSLSKIQKGDRVMDWLQIKLRKFVDQTKKEKHKREIQNFRKSKFIELKKNGEIDRNREKKPAALLTPEEMQILGVSRQNNTNRNNNHSQQKNTVPHSLSRSREKSPIETSRKSSQSHSYAQYSYHKNFSFLTKAKDISEHPKGANHKLKLEQATFGKQKQLQKRFTHLNRSVEHLSKIGTSLHSSKPKNVVKAPVNNTKNIIKTNERIERQIKRGNENIKQIIKKAKEQEDISKEEINQLTKLFTQQLNSDTIPNPPAVKPIQPASHLTFPEPSFDFQIFPSKTQQHKRINSFNKETAENNKNSDSYEQSTKKIQAMLESSKFILEQLNSNPVITDTQYQRNEGSAAKPAIDPPFEPAQEPIAQSNYQTIFTPPDFLAQCRKIISSSNKKKETEGMSWKDHLTIDESQSGKKLTFNNLLSQSKQKIQEEEDKFQYFNLQEVISQNASANISTKKPESEVQFQLKNITIHSLEQLLLAIFKDQPRVTLDRYQIGQIMSKCEEETEALLQKYCDSLNKEHYGHYTAFQVKFVPMLKFFYTYGQIFKETEDHFANFLCSILDMNKNGYISSESIQDFIESMEGSGIEAELLREIQSLLFSIFERCREVEEGGSIITRWSLFYLQLKSDHEASTLKELLSRFEFQIDQQE